MKQFKQTNKKLIKDSENLHEKYDLMNTKYENLKITITRYIDDKVKDQNDRFKEDWKKEKRINSDLMTTMNDKIISISH